MEEHTLKWLSHRWVTTCGDCNDVVEFDCTITFATEVIEMKKHNLPECPVATTVEIIGSKWKLLILRNLLVRPWRFNELKRSLDGISQKVLTDALRALENHDIVIRTVYPEVPARVEYSLSETGESLRPVLKSMENWGIEYKLRTDR